MRISATGAVGIGVSSASGALQIFKAGQSSYQTYSNTGLGAIVQSYQSQGNPYTKTTDIVAGSDGTVPSEIRLLTRTAGSSTVTERVRISATGSVGIGTASIGGSATTKLHLRSATTSSPTVANDADELIIEGSGSSGMTFLSTTSSNIRFGDAADSSIGQISYNHAGNYLLFGTNNAERARLTSDGALLISTTDPSPVGNNVAGGIALLNNGSGQFSRDGGTTLLLNRKSSNGELLRFNKDGAIAGGIGVNDGDVYIGTGDTTLRFADSANAVIPRGTDGAVRDAAVSLGNGSNRFSDLFLSGGVFLGGSGAANKLDDYEEGTWTPVFKDSSNNSASAGTASGTYVKIGSVVHVQGNLININTSGLTSGDTALLIGLPFVINTASATRCHGLLQTNDVTFAEGTPYIQGINNQSKCNFRFNKTGAVAQGMAVNTFSSGVADVFFSMSYQTTA